jgi:hypothetical protein
MVAVLRFPNPGSDLTRIVHIFSLIAEAAGDDIFDLDFMTEVATRNLQASSVGAQGSTALQLSTRDDRSRDPLYNQMKMYSEVYRMLGLMRPMPERRLSFFVTELGATLSEWYHARRQVEWSSLLEESLLAVVFPNPATENVGVLSQRPFKWLLQLTMKLDGIITRHEMISGLLAVPDDRQPKAMSNAVAEIRNLRAGEPQVAVDAARLIATANGVQLNTLENYTRLPVGVLKSPVLGWGRDVRRRDLYSGSGSVVAIELTERGSTVAAAVSQMVDVRVDTLQGLPSGDRVAFASFTFAEMLTRAGILGDSAENARHLEIGRSVARSIGVSDHETILFSPSLQEDFEILSRAVREGSQS